MTRLMPRASVLVLVFMFLVVACREGTEGVDAGSGSVATSPGFGEGVGGQWRLVATGVDEGVAWEVAAKSDGEMVCYYAELDPPPAAAYFIDPRARPGASPRDLLIGGELADGSEDLLDQFAGCAPIPTELGDDGRALQQIEAQDAAAFFVEHGDGLAYRFVEGVVARDASAVNLIFDDGSSKDVSPIDGTFVSVFAANRRVTRVEVSNRKFEVTCSLSGRRFEEYSTCGNVVKRDAVSTSTHATATSAG